MIAAGPLDLSTAARLLVVGYRYWDEARGDRPMPTRADIQPERIVQLLPNIMLIDVLRDPADFRYRLVGTQIDFYAAARYTGKRMSEIPHQRPPSQIWSEFARVVNDGQPTLNKTPYVGAQRDFLSIEHLVCPLGCDGIVTMLFCVVEFLPRTGVDME
jgi:hypothetical protein